MGDIATQLLKIKNISEKGSVNSLKKDPLTHSSITGVVVG